MEGHCSSWLTREAISCELSSRLSPLAAMAARSWFSRSRATLRCLGGSKRLNGTLGRRAWNATDGEIQDRMAAAANQREETRGDIVLRYDETGSQAPVVP